MKRREFLKITSVGGAGSLLLESCKREKSTPQPVREDAPMPGFEEWVSSFCLQCPGGCGITVRVVEGKAKKIEGLAGHPINQGKLCARGQAGLQVLYNPDRIKEPLKRNGPRGAGQWSKIGWEEAIKTTIGKLSELRQRGEPHTLVFFTGTLRGHMKSLVERFMTAFGSPNHIAYELFSDGPLLKANRLNMGHEAFAAYDLENTNYLLSFGAEFLETSRSPVRYNLAYGHMRQGRPGLRSKIVQIQSRFSLTAANADAWVPVKPGTEGALALAIAHWLIKEGLYDKEFVARSTSGFDTFKDLVLKEYAPEKVAAITDVAVQEIHHLAKEFATHRPSLAIGGDSALAHTNGLSTALAVNALNALVGNVGKPGGIFFDPQPSFSNLPAVRKDAVAEKGSRMARLDRGDGSDGSAAASSMQSVSERILFGRPYATNVVFLYEENPVFSLPGSLRFREALEKVPFVVSFSSFMDESTKMADLILPDHTYLERWQDDVPSPGVGIPIASIMKPVVKPLYNTRSTADVLIQLAKGIGSEVASAFPWETFVDLLKQAYGGIHQQKRGSVTAEDFNEFWQKLVNQGGWWHAEHKKEVAFHTPSRKFELMPRPHGLYEPPAFDGGENEYPFHLNIYQSIALSDGRGANQPWLQEMPDPMTSICWGSWVEINPNTAAKLAIKEGDWVWVESAHGKIKIAAVIFPGAMPNVVNIPVGQGHEAYGRYAQGRGANPLAIVARLCEPVSGAPAWAATRVKVYKAGGTARLAKFGLDRVAI